ncbi:WXG100 family type VII secretion target [Actinokineospora sp. HUAS TT18]|uniref:WXG100 family type VII secretion target n=1 Tax=Actinokineospora sp. HUAS TT18 TaxID=3447451 RepID=UPI003F51C10D
MDSGQQGADRYVTGGVNWDAYSLEALVAMVAENASAPQLERLADDWRAAGSEVTDASSVLANALEDLMQYWSGAAAEQAREDVALNAQWVGDLGETARQIGDPVQEAAGALKAAQDAMPTIPPTPPVDRALAVDNAEQGLAAGGPLAAAINGTAAGADSAFAAEQEQSKLKAVAVEAMKRFEGAALGIDAATPRFEGPDTQLHTPPNVTPPVVQPPNWNDVSYVTDVELRWTSLTGGDPTTTAQGYDSSDTRGTGSGGSGGGGGYAGGLGGGGMGGGGAGSASARPLQPGLATGLTEALSAGGRPAAAMGGAAASAATGQHASPMGMGGMPMGGMGAGAGSGDQGEHRRRYPFDAEDPFALDQKASPPVIGL